MTERNDPLVLDYFPLTLPCDCLLKNFPPDIFTAGEDDKSELIEPFVVYKVDVSGASWPTCTPLGASAACSACAQLRSPAAATAKLANVS